MSATKARPLNGKPETVIPKSEETATRQTDHTSKEGTTPSWTGETPVPQELAALREELSTLRAQVEATERDAALRQSLAAVPWFDARDAYRELAERVERDGQGRWIVKDKSETANHGKPETANPKSEETARRQTQDEKTEGTAPLGTGGTPVLREQPLDEAVRELARQKPHWVRARVSGGTGAGGSGGAGGAGASTAGVLSYAELLKPENMELLQEFIHNRKEQLERLRQIHFGF